VNDRVVIDRRFNGPPNSANGGYTCGLVGTAVKARAVRVSLLKPPPLDVPLLRQRADDGSVSLLRGDDVIATAVPGAVQAQAPPAPTVEQAEIATLSYVGFAHHRFPTCFVCRDRARRRPADLRRSCRGQPARRLPWTPESDDPLFAWAVLDCPSAYAFESVGHRAQIVVLASLTSSSVSAHAPGSDTSSPRGRSAATAGSTTRLPRSTTRRDASSRSPTHSGSSYETPPRSAAEPLASPPDCALVGVKAVFTRSWSRSASQARRRGDMSARPVRRARAWASSAASVASASRRATLVRISSARS
jgi:hypothetical protein